jgi:peptide deformylase
MWSNGGIGLAAPQVGMAIRMFVMGPQEGPNYVCINPEVLEIGEETMGQEGCLSYPGLWLNIKRPEWVHARYRTLNGETVEQRFEGLLARCYLHELDHLNGSTFVNKVKPLSLKLAKERQKKNLRKMKRVS